MKWQVLKLNKFRYKAVIFDLDGTLLDTLDDLMASVNFALEKNGYEKRTKEEIRMFVGNGVVKLVERAAGLSQDMEEFKHIFADFKEHYGEHCNDRTGIYDGMDRVLRVLRQENILTAIVSNKADFAVQQLKDIYFDGLVDAAIGESSGIRKKPAPDMVLKALDILKVSEDECVYVGDSDVDIMTAKNCGMDIISVLWGFRSKDFLMSNGAVTFADTADELMSALLENEQQIDGGTKQDK